MPTPTPHAATRSPAEPSPVAADPPLRICLFSHNFFPRVGGLEQAGLSLATAWAAEGHAVTVVTVIAPPDGQSAAEYDRQFPFPVVRLERATTRGRAGWAAWGPILRRADVLVSNGMSMTYYTAWRRHGVPVVYLHQLFLGVDPWDLPGPPSVQLRRWGRLVARRWVLRRAAGNVFISRFIRRRVGVTNGVVIYNPVDPQFAPTPDAPPAGDVGFFGRMVEEKGVGHLLAAVRACRDRGHRFTLDLYGEGPYLGQFQALAVELGLGPDQVRWHGFARGRPLVAAMNAAGVVVVPSVWEEPMGIVAVEAMACGRCVVGSAGGGLGEVLDGVCPTYPNGDTAALADRLISVLGDPAARGGYERAALARSAAFELGGIARQYVDYFRAVLRRRG